MKLRLVVLYSFFILGGVFGQIGFLEHQVIDNLTVSRPSSSYPFDMDNDGDMDVLSVSSKAVFWYENNDGKGEFIEQHIIIEDTGSSIPQENYSSCYASDFDGDGDLDVVTASSTDDRIAWYENIDGLGNFSLKQNVSESADGAKIVMVNDFDGDGDMDIISYSANDLKIAWYENTDGLGSFSGEQLVIIETETLSYLNLKDMDEDNDIDIIYKKETFLGNITLIWYENIDGLGTFSNQHIITVDTTDFLSANIDLGDKDGDGDIDILYAYNDAIEGYGVRWYENIDGMGNFNPYELAWDSTSRFGIIKLEDLDNDGDSDFLFRNGISTNDTIWIMDNSNNQGDFSSKDFVGKINNQYSTIEVGDINGDSNLDILSSGWDNDIQIGWFENLNEQNTFSSQQLIATYSSSPSSGIGADLDGDGDIDLLSSFGGKKGIAWYENKNGDGDFGMQKIISIEDGGYKIDVADIDNDGDMDVIGSNENILYWYENLDGLGNFSSEKDISSFNLNSFCLADVDGDSDIDIIIGGFTGIVWLENLDGLGNFDSGQMFFFAFGDMKTVYASDLDGDGDMDIIAGDQENDNIIWYENLDGLGNFDSEKIITLLVDEIESVHASDLDGDGDMDVLSASLDDDKIAWYENIDGLGSFSPQKIISVENNKAKIVLTSDIDGDGDLDVITSTSNSYEIVWYENIDGIGNFGTPQIIEINDDIVNSIFTEDIDNDGDMDVVSIARPHNVTWYENVNSIKNEINGYLRLDIDADGCDIDDPTGAKVMIITENNSNNLATFSTDIGFYQLFPKEGSFTTYVSTMLPNYYDATPVSFSSDFMGVGNVENMDFCFVPNQQINDLDILLIPSTQARPGFDTYYQIVFRNKGTTQLNGTVTLEFNDTKLNFLSASETIASQNNNTLTFDYLELNPFETRTIDLNFNVFPPPTVNIDEVLNFTATINPIVEDFTKEDNVFNFDQTVIGSYDPNDIRVLEGDEILLEDINQYLHYIIRFQNTGTASAINVRVENILDDKLDWSSIQLESSSHPNRVEIKDGNEVAFIFDGINLPDSTTNELASNGFIAYKIKPKSDIQLGDIISSTADIYFDFNPAVVTNTAMTEVVEPIVSVDDYSSLIFSIYPIPTTGILSVQSENAIAQIEIFDQFGKLILFNSNKTEIDISSLSRGFYFCKVKGEDGETGIKKVVKE